MNAFKVIKFSHSKVITFNDAFNNFKEEEEEEEEDKLGGERMTYK